LLLKGAAGKSSIFCSLHPIAIYNKFTVDDYWFDKPEENMAAYVAYPLSTTMISYSLPGALRPSESRHGFKTSQAFRDTMQMEIVYKLPFLRIIG
jgi:hypothetical protein